MSSTARSRLGEEEYQRRVKRTIDLRKTAEQFEAFNLVLKRMVDQINEDHPGGCERCGEAFDAEGPAEIVDANNEHLIVHVSCIINNPPRPDRMA